ncbi:MAG: cupin domain-containing protein [Candidatus Delongbacteria bacterium]|nr:cupin domain-containing protein [Candidatus Delongbacteria bacterium]
MLKKFNDAPVILDEEKVTGKRLSKDKYATYVHISIKPGGEIAPHKVPFDATFYVASGQGKATVNGETFSLTKGDVIHIVPNVERGWKNTGSEEAEFLVIQH